MPKPVITTTQPDGLYLSTQASLSQLREDETLRLFANGLLIKTLNLQTFNLQPSTFKPSNLQTFNALTLAQALHHPGPELYPLLAALLALDAEVQAVVDDKRRRLSLPGFLSYRPHLPLDKVPLQAVRLPPLNPGGRYHFSALPDDLCLAARLDLHPTRSVAGHVRLVLSSLTRPPTRLRSIEQRLDRHFVNAALIETAIATGSGEITPALTPAEQAALIETLMKLINADGR